MMARYTSELKYKMARYYSLGIRITSIYPDNMKNLDWVSRKKFRHVTGKGFPRR